MKRPPVAGTRFTFYDAAVIVWSLGLAASIVWGVRKALKQAREERKAPARPR